MKKHNIALMALAALFCTTACTQDDLDVFSMEHSTAYFEANNYEYSFIDTPDAATADVDIPVTIVGPIAQYDRAIQAQVIETGTTATPDQYELVGGMIKAGQTQGVFTVRVHNDPSLEEGDLSVGLRLTDNEHFTIDLDTTTVRINNQPINTRTTLVWTNQLPMPEYWLKGNYARYVSFTALWRDNEGNVYGEQNAEGTRVRLSAKYSSNGTYSKALGRILRQVWPLKVNVNGYLGRDEETLAQYPIVTATGGLSVLLVHTLEQYVHEYNLAHPGQPLRHSDDCAVYNSAGNIVKVTSGGVSYELRLKGNPPIMINPFAGQYGY